MIILYINKRSIINKIFYLIIILIISSIYNHEPMLYVGNSKVFQFMNSTNSGGKNEYNKKKKKK